MTSPKHLAEFKLSDPAVGGWVFSLIESLCRRDGVTRR